MMDAIEFVKQLRRMDKQGGPKNRFIYPCAGQEPDSPEEVVAEVEEWAKDHPIKTRQSEFLKLFPGAAPTKDGVLAICPNAFSPVYKDERGLCKWHYAECDNCCRKFWSAEVEE